MGRQGENPLPDRDSMPRSFDRVARMATRPVLVVAVLASIANLVGAQQPGIDGPSKALEGRWKLELYLDKPSARVEPMAGQINGEIGFSTLAWWNPSDRFGRHSLNLQSFFGSSFRRPDVAAFTPADTSMVTEVSGSVRGDSVGIDFIPRVDHGGLSMWGRFWGDSAKGRWYRRGNDGEGHFVLRRISKEAVTVALIPDGRPTVVAAAVPAKKLTKAEARALARKEAAAKAKARSDSIAVARAEAQKKAKEEALAKAAARDSAKAVALAAAKAKKAAQDSVRAQALADAKAKREAAAQAKVAANTSPKPAADAAPASVATVATSTAGTGAPAAGIGGAVPNALTSTPTAGDSRSSRSAPPSTPVRVASATPAPAAPTRTATPDAGAPAASAPSDPAAAVPLRVRIFDEASKKYFVTTYSLHLPDGHWMYGKLRTGNGPDGFGPAIPRTPGKYEIEITNFMCGGKLWFFKDKILQTVEIAPGTPADVTINVNLPEAPARPSLENKAGEKCTAPVS